jgi:choline monooxygenase
MANTQKFTFEKFSLADPVQRGLPSFAYTDDEFFKLEAEKLFADSWVFAGFAHSLSQAGDVMPVNVAGQPVLLVRNVDDEINAFQNVCRHRCAKLVETAGNVGRMMTCPYHAWVYGLDGGLRVAPFFGGRQNRPPEGFDLKQHGLIPIRCHVWYDWVFVNLNGNAGDFKDFVAPLAKRLDDIDLSDLSLVGLIDFGEVETNWKFLMENFMEPYHVPVVHPSTTNQPLADHKTFIDGHCLGSVVNLQDDADKAAQSDNLNVSSRYLTLFPSFVLGRYFPDQLGVYLNEPVAPGLTRQHRAIYLTSGEPHSVETAKHLKKLWYDVHKEDHGVCERLQRGRAAPIAQEGGFLSPYWEDSVRRFQELVVEGIQ